MSARAVNALEFAIKRHQGMDDATREKLSALNASKADWTATCRKCGEVLEGTPAQIRGHVCGKSN